MEIKDFNREDLSLQASVEEAGSQSSFHRRCEEIIRTLGGDRGGERMNLQG